MRLYEYDLLIDDIVMDHGYIHASNEEQFEKRFKKEVYPKKVFDHLVYRESFCECGSDNDVTRYFIHDKAFIHCKECRADNVGKFVEHVNQKALSVLKSKD